MKIAVFGDVHGRIDLVYQSCKAWQIKNEDFIDLILQVGDLGIYTNLNSINNGDRKKIATNPEELNLYHCLRDIKKYKALLKNGQKYGTVNAKLIFVDGNHDDQTYLENLVSKKPNEGIIPINDYLWYLNNSIPVGLYNEKGSRFNIAGIGGIDQNHRAKKVEKDPRIAFTEQEVNKALDCTNVDIFLTHMYPEYNMNDGSVELKELIEIIQPQYYFFGHHHRYVNFKIGETECYGLTKIQNGNLKDDGSSMLVLEKKGKQITVY